MKLGDIVNKAMADAEGHLKVASEQDAPEQASVGGEVIPLDSVLGEPQGMSDEEYQSQQEDDEEEPKVASMHSAEYALQLADALDHSANIFAKVANSPLDAPGPAVLQSDLVGATTQHPTPKPSSVPVAQASHGGGGDEDRNDGNTTGIETNRSEYTDPDWTKNKEAALAVLNTKVAQAEALLEAGNIDAAEHMFKQAQVEYAKVAQDPSSPQPELSTGSSHNPALDTSPGEASHIPDNSGAAGMTKRQAKTNFVKSEAAQFLQEAAFSSSGDPGIKANLSQGVETAKISHVFSHVDFEKEAGLRSRARAMAERGAAAARRVSRGESSAKDELRAAASQAVGKRPGSGLATTSRRSVAPPATARSRAQARAVDAEIVQSSGKTHTPAGSVPALPAPKPSVRPPAAKPPAAKPPAAKPPAAEPNEAAVEAGKKGMPWGKAALGTTAAAGTLYGGKKLYDSRSGKRKAASMVFSHVGNG